MTVILVLATFAIFILIDYVQSRRKARVVVREAEPVAVHEPVLAPNMEAIYVEGYALPINLRFHPGHTWVMRERKNLVRVGVDEFAAVLLGRVERIDLPKPGHWVRQGQKAWVVYYDGRKVAMVSPIEGEIVAVNSDLGENPSLLQQQPYGEGWVMSVHVPDEESNYRNLLRDSLARTWMSEAATRLRTRLSEYAGAYAQDGGRPVHDVCAHLPEKAWRELVHEFLLT